MRDEARSFTQALFIMIESRGAGRLSADRPCNYARIKIYEGTSARRPGVIIDVYRGDSSYAEQGTEILRVECVTRVLRDITPLATKIIGDTERPLDLSRIYRAVCSRPVDESLRLIRILQMSAGR